MNIKDLICDLAAQAAESPNGFETEILIEDSLFFVDDSAVADAGTLQFRRR